MEGKELHRHLLGLEELWFVKQIKLDFKDQRIDVFVEPTREVSESWCIAGSSLYRPNQRYDLQLFLNDSLSRY